MIAEYPAIRKITDPHEFRIAREHENDPNRISGKEGIFMFYQMMGMDISYDEIFED